MSGTWLWLVAAVGLLAAALGCWEVWRRAAKGRITTGRAAAVIAGLVGFAVVAIVAVVIYEQTIGARAVASAARAGLVVGSVLTLVLFTVAVVGDPSRGRRRCPKCWYSMTGAPGLVCPECGGDARREARLFKTRRRKAFVVGSLAPFVLGAAVFGVWFANRYDRVQAMPSAALIVIAACQDSTNSWTYELANRAEDTGSRGLGAWARRLSAAVSHRIVRGSGQPKRVLMHVRQLLALGAADDTTTAALLTMSQEKDVMVAGAAAWNLGSMRPTDEIEAALTALATRPEPRMKDCVARGLRGIKSDRPGGAAPAMLVAEASAMPTSGRSAMACQVLGMYDPSEESRRALMIVAKAPEPHLRMDGITALSRLYPNDPEVQRMLIDLVRDRTDASEGRPEVIVSVLEADRWACDASGAMSEKRRALYSDGVRAAIVDTAEKAPVGASTWRLARELLAKHPSFSGDERRRAHVP